MQLDLAILKQRLYQLTVHGELLPGQELVVLPDRETATFISTVEALIGLSDRSPTMRTCAYAFLLLGKERFCAFDGLCGDFQFSQHSANVLQEGVSAFLTAFDALQTLLPFCGQKW